MDQKDFKNTLSEAFINLIDSKRGIATKMAKAIGKPPSFVSQVKRGKPVNALHLKAVGLIFGAEKVLELLALNNTIDKNYSNNPKFEFKNEESGLKNVESLIWIERESDGLYKELSNHIQIVHNTAKTLSEERKKTS